MLIAVRTWASTRGKGCLAVVGNGSSLQLALPRVEWMKLARERTTRVSSAV